MSLNKAFPVHALTHELEQLMLAPLGAAVGLAVVEDLVDPCEAAHREVQAHPVEAGLQAYQLIFGDGHAKGLSMSCTSKASTPPLL